MRIDEIKLYVENVDYERAAKIFWRNIYNFHKNDKEYELNRQLRKEFFKIINEDFSYIKEKSSMFKNEIEMIFYFSETFLSNLEIEIDFLKDRDDAKISFEDAVKAVERATVILKENIDYEVKELLALKNKLNSML